MLARALLHVDQEADDRGTKNIDVFRDTGSR